MSRCQILEGDCMDVLPTLPAESVHCVVTSPPYWGLRDYGTAEWEGGDAECHHEGDGPAVGNNMNVRGKDEVAMPVGGWQKASDHGNQYRTVPNGGTCGKCGARRLDRQLGLESTPEEYVEKLVAVFREVRRVLRSDGTVWLNLGDSYAGSNRGSAVSDEAFARLQGDSSVPVTKGGRRATSMHLDKCPIVAPGLKPKDLVGVPWCVAFALQADGWWLRSAIVWAKPNPMPESVTDRPTSSYEMVFLLAKSSAYYYDTDAIRETDAGHASGNGYARAHRLSYDGRGQEDQWLPGGGRNKRNVWTIATKPFAEAHFATFPEDLVTPCVLAGTSEQGCCVECGAPRKRVVESERVPPRTADVGARERRDHDRPNGADVAKWRAENPVRTVGWQPSCSCTAAAKPCTVLDPFAGAGTVGVVCSKLGRDFVGIELNPEYAAMARRRIAGAPLSLFSAGVV